MIYPVRSALQGGTVALMPVLVRRPLTEASASRDTSVRSVPTSRPPAHPASTVRRLAWRHPPVTALQVGTIFNIHHLAGEMFFIEGVGMGITTSVQTLT